MPLSYQWFITRIMLFLSQPRKIEIAVLAYAISLCGIGN